VIIRLVRAQDQIRRHGHELVYDDEGVASIDADRRSEAGNRPDRLDLLVACRAQGERPGVPLHLDRVRVHVSADDRDDEPFGALVVISTRKRAHEENDLAGPLRSDVQERGQLHDRLRSRRMDSLDRLQCLIRWVAAIEASDLKVRGVVAGRAPHEAVLSDRRDVHELVRHLSAHHPHVAEHREEGQAGTPPDLEVGLVVSVVLALQTLVVTVQ
jgi:hypothetical protein